MVLFIEILDVAWTEQVQPYVKLWASLSAVLNCVVLIN
jgi:hypothetical protein